METKLVEQLKTLKKIAPSADFSAKSKAIILAERNFQETLPEINKAVFFAKRQFASALIAGTCLIVVFAGGFSYFSRMFDKSNAVAKAGEINSSIQVKLNEIKYYIENKEPIDRETATKLNSLLTEVKAELESAASSLKEEQVDQFLSKIKSSQELIIQANDKLQTK